MTDRRKRQKPVHRPDRCRYLTRVRRRTVRVAEVNSNSECRSWLICLKWVCQPRPIQLGRGRQRQHPHVIEFTCGDRVAIREGTNKSPQVPDPAPTWFLDEFLSQPQRLARTLRSGSSAN